MKPKKHFIDRAIENGSIDRLNKLLSASHILLCVSNNYVEEAADLMKANGLLLGDLKKLHNNFLTAADRYFSEFATMVTDAKMDMFVTGFSLTEMELLNPVKDLIMDFDSNNLDLRSGIRLETMKEYFKDDK